MWRILPKAPAINYDNDDTIQAEVKRAFTEGHLKRIRQNQIVANLKIPDEAKDIIVKAPSTSCNSTVVGVFSHVVVPGEAVAGGTMIAIGRPLMAEIDNKYRHLVLRSTTQRIFIKADIQLNGVEDVMMNNFPEFVESFERSLGQKRNLRDDRVSFTLHYHIVGF